MSHASSHSLVILSDISHNIGVSDLSRRKDTTLRQDLLPPGWRIPDMRFGTAKVLYAIDFFRSNNFPLESAVRRGKRYVWNRSGRKIRWNLACRVNIDVILVKWHDPHGCAIEIRISRIKRALEGNDIACVIAERFYRSAGMYGISSSNFCIRKFFEMT